VIVQFVMAWRKELKMYQPVLKDSMIKTLYRVKQAYKKPMTKVAENLMQQGLSLIDREQVCKTCASEGNSQCNECCLANGKELQDEKHY